MNYEGTDMALPPKRIKVEWKWVAESLAWQAEVPAVDHTGPGKLILYACLRPAYCDRGRWHVLVDSEAIALDRQEGFPRYFFKIDTLKDEMELWVNAREECKRAAV